MEIIILIIVFPWMLAYRTGMSVYCTVTRQPTPWAKARQERQERQEHLAARPAEPATQSRRTLRGAAARWWGDFWEDWHTARDERRATHERGHRPPRGSWCRWVRGETTSRPDRSRGDDTNQPQRLDQEPNQIPDTPVPTDDDGSNSATASPRRPSAAPPKPRTCHWVDRDGQRCRATVIALWACEAHRCTWIDPNEPSWPCGCPRVADEPLCQQHKEMAASKDNEAADHPATDMFPGDDTPTPDLPWRALPDPVSDDNTDDQPIPRPRLVVVPGGAGEPDASRGEPATVVGDRRGSDRQQYLSSEGDQSMSTPTGAPVVAEGAGAVQALDTYADGIIHSGQIDWAASVETARVNVTEAGLAGDPDLQAALGQIEEAAQMVVSAGQAIKTAMATHVQLAEHVSETRHHGTKIDAYENQ